MDFSRASRILFVILVNFMLLATPLAVADDEGGEDSGGDDGGDWGDGGDEDSGDVGDYPDPDYPEPDTPVPDYPEPDTPVPDYPEPDTPTPDVPAPDTPVPPPTPTPVTPTPPGPEPCDVPGVPTLSSPAEGASLSSTTSQVTLSWQNGASSYDVRADYSGATERDSRNNCAGSPHFVCINSFGSSSITINVRPGTTYSWWVHGRNGCGTGEFARRTFSVQSVPPSPANRVPSWNSIGSKEGQEGTFLTFDSTAFDSDGNFLTFTASGMPTNAVTDQTSGGAVVIRAKGEYASGWPEMKLKVNGQEVRSWTVDSSSYRDFTASVPSYSDGQEIAVVFTNDLVVSGADRNLLVDTITVNDRIIQARSVVYDRGDGAAAFDGTDLISDRSEYMPWSGALRFALGPRFIWTPDFTQSGSYQVTYTASDGSLSASAAIPITIGDVPQLPVNRPPVLDPIGSKSVNEGSTLEFVISGSDPDNNPLSFFGLDLPRGAVFNPSTRTFRWTPDFDQAGSYQVGFSVSDGSLTDSETITITVNNLNRGPFLDPIADRQVREGQLLQFTVSGSDTDGDALTFSASSLPRGASFDSATRTFSWTPGFDQAGVYDGNQAVRFTVTDTGGLSHNRVVVITVLDVVQPVANRPPVLDAIGAKHVFEGSLLTFTVSGSDPDGDQLFFRATGIPSGASFNAATRQFSWTPSFTQSGSYQVTFIVADSTGTAALEDSETIAITVVNVNQAPVLDSIGPRSVNENQLLQFTVSGSDPDGDALSFTAGSLPSGASFNSATRIFSWTPNSVQSGTYNVRFSVSDGKASDFEDVVITVNDIIALNSPPVLDSIGPKSVSEGQLLQFAVSGSDSDGDALSFTASNLPSGASFNSATRTFSWTPSFAQSGVYDGVVFAVSDGKGGSDSEAVTITVNNVNRAPSLSPVGNKAVNENSLLQFSVSASDPDGDSITFSSSALPSGASFSSSTGIFSWTPSFTQSGSYQVTFTASDGSLSSSEAITITVNNVNRAPVLSPVGNKVVNEGVLLQFSVSASDPDGDSITFSSSALPSGASFSSSTGIFSWTPSFVQSGSYQVAFSASDGSLAASETITITVGNVNRAPVLSAVGSKAVNENSLLQFTVSGSDPDGDALTFSASALPSGASFGTATGVFSWTPSFVQSGSYQVTFSASDGSLAASETITITVSNVNRAPVLDPVGNKIVNEGVLLQFTVSGSDPDGASLTFAASGLPSGASFSTATGVFSWTPSFAQSGSYQVTFSVTDSSLVATETITITVNNVNRAPVLNPIGARSVNENQPLQFTVSGSDPDGDAVTFPASNLPAGASYTVSNGVFSWTPSFFQAGSYQPTFSISDGSLATSETVTITVNNVNRAPSLGPVGNKVVSEGVALQFTVSGSDPDNDVLAFSAVGLPSGAFFSTVTGAFSWTPSFAQSGSYQVTFSVSDGSLSASETITITVTNVNRAPVLSAVGSKAVNENSLLQFTVSASDPDGDSITFSSSALPSGASFSSSTGIFSWTPSFTQSGSYQVTFTASDGSLPSSEAITITVNNVNRAPVLSPVGNKVVNENQLLQFTVSGSDPDGDAVTFPASNLPAGASYTVSNGVFSWTPSFTQSGSYQVTFSINDGSLSSSETITITVNNVNRAPVLSPVGNKVVNENQLLQFTVSGSDPDGDAVTFPASNLPAGASYTVSNGVFSWTPSFTQSGSYQVTFSASDGSLATSEVVTITVNNVNRAPVLNPIGNKAVNEGSPLQFTVSGSDPDSDALTFSASNLPSGATFSPSSGAFSWTPSFEQAGSYTVTFVASDRSLTASETITISVANVNRGPRITTTPLGELVENDLKGFSTVYNYDADAVDPDNDRVTFSLTVKPDGATVNPDTGLVLWTPGSRQLGPAFFTIVASDGNLNDTQSWTVTVKLPDRIGIPRQELFVEHVILPECIEAGDRALVYVSVENIGNYPQDEVTVTALAFDDDMRKRIGPFDLDIGESVSKPFYMDIPEDAAPGKYDMRITISNDFVRRVKHREVEISARCAG